MTGSRPHFEGNVDTRWLVHGGADREMELLSPFAFVDSTGYRWAAHPGEKVDGASIPDQVWSTVVGTPFIGDYRRASVVHDVACERHERTSREAHRMFYEAMLADGTEKARALLFYTAVRLFGPQWDQQRGFRPMLAHRAQDIDFDRLEAALDEVIDAPAAPPRSGPSSKGRRTKKTGGTKKRRRAGRRR
jgi:Protein of unknown function (DUF1353)